MLGFWDVTLLGIGLIIGAGIYVLIGEAWAISGSGIPYAFAIAGTSALFTANSFAKLAVKYPGNQSVYEYVKHSFGDDFGFLAFWMTVMSIVSTIAAVALGFGNYFTYFGFNQKIAALAVLVICACINIIGAKITSGINNIITIIESSGLVVIILIALMKGSMPVIEFTPGVLRATSLIFFAYLGFGAITTAMEETKNAKVTIPKAILASVLVCTILYILTSLAFLSLNGERDAPIASAAKNALGPVVGSVFALIAIFATSNTVLLSFFQGSRLVYGAGKMLGSSNLSATRNGVPLNGILIVLGFSALFLSNDIVFAADTSNLLLLSVFAMINFSALQRSMEGVFDKLTGLSAIGGIVTSILLISRIQYWIAAAFVTGAGALLKIAGKRDITVKMSPHI